MPLRLHRCPLGFIKTKGHGCYVTAIREEGKVFVEIISSGRLFEGRPGGPAGA